MQVVYRASTQCDSCLTVTDTPFPGWGTARAGLEEYNRMPLGWTEIKIDIPGRGYGPYSICPNCGILPMLNVIANMARNWNPQPQDLPS